MSEMNELIKNFVEETTKNLVDNPEKISVTVSLSTKNVIVQIDTDKKDSGKVIGKKGRTIEALKILTLAIKNTNFPDDRRKVSIELLEDEDSQYNYRD